MKSSYIWKGDYVLPYESLYSVREKFCYLNAVNWSYFIKARDRIDGVEGLDHLYHYSVLGANVVPGFSLPCYEEIRYCPLCVQYGYHSVFHQATPFMTCFIHIKQPLIRIARRSSIIRTNDVLYGTQGQYLNASPRIEDVIYPAFLLKKAKTIWHTLKKIESLYFLDTNHQKHEEDWMIYDSSSKLIQMLFRDKLQPSRGITLVMQKTDEELFGNDCREYFVDSTPYIVRSYFENEFNENFSDSYEYLKTISNLIDNIKLCKEHSSKYAVIILIYSTIYNYNERMYEKFRNYQLRFFRLKPYKQNRIIEVMYKMDRIRIPNQSNRNDFVFGKMNVFKEAVFKESFEFAKNYLTEYLSYQFDKLILSDKNVFLADIPIKYPQFFLVKENGVWSLYKCI